MIHIKDQTNAIPVDGVNLYGDIKDDSGVFDGVPLNRALLSQNIQFFERMFSASSLVANGLLENNTNGYQLFEALEDISNEIKLRGSRGYTNPTALTADVDTTVAGYVQFNVLFKVLDLVLNAPFTDKIVSLGAANVGAEVFIYINPLATNIPRFSINSTNLGTGAVIKKNGVTAANTDFTPTASTTLHFVKMVSHWDLSVRP